MSKSQAEGEAARQKRLAAALRENLLKRKARDRAMSEPPADGQADGGDAGISASSIAAART